MTTCDHNMHSCQLKILEEEIVVLKAQVEAAKRWLIAFDNCGPDNGPNMDEHFCADEFRKLVEEDKNQ